MTVHDVRPCCGEPYDAEHRDGCRYGTTMTELHAIRQHLGEGRASHLEDYLLEVTDAALRTLERHRSRPPQPDSSPSCNGCNHAWPCDDVLDQVAIYAPRLDKEPAR